MFKDRSSRRHRLHRSRRPQASAQVIPPVIDSLALDGSRDTTKADSTRIFELERKVEALQAELRAKDAELAMRRVETNTSAVLHLFHFTDVYNIGELELPDFCADDRVGGALRFKTLVDGAARERMINPMLLFSGDFVSPSLTSTATFGRHMVETFNLLGVDFGCFGNHDLDYGLEAGPNHQGLRAILQDRYEGFGDSSGSSYYYPASGTKWLCSNIIEADGQPLAGAARDAIVDWCSDTTGKSGTVRVGLFAVGYDWRESSNPHDLTYIPAVEEARRRVQDLRARGAQVVIALTHLPLTSSSGEASDETLLRDCPGIDLVLGGHDHFYYYAGNLIKSGSDFRHLSYITVRLENDQVASIDCERFDVTRGVPQNAEMQALVQRYEQLVEFSFGRRVGSTLVALDSREQTVRFGESRLMNFVCDAAFSHVLVSNADLDVDACLLEAYHIAGEHLLPPGKITVKDLLLWLGSHGEIAKLVVIRLSGREVKDHIERGLVSLPDESWALMHVASSLRYAADLSLPAGRRLTDLTFRGKPLLNEHELTCVVEANFAKYWAPSAAVLANAEGTRALLDVVRHQLELSPEITEDLAPLGRLEFTLPSGPRDERALGKPGSGLPNVSTDIDASREKFRSATTLLRLDPKTLKLPPVAIGTNNFSKLLRLVEVFAAHGVPVEHQQGAVPLASRPSLVDDELCELSRFEHQQGAVPLASRPSLVDDGLCELSRFEVDCVWKMLAYPAGTLVTVAGLCVEPRGPELRGDQWFFADSTPVGTEVYVKDRLGLGVSGRHYRFRPSRSLSTFLSREASFSVLFGRVRPGWAASCPDDSVELRCEFFSGGTIYGSIAAAQGVRSPAPCVPFEYMFSLNGSGGRTIAKERAEQWEKLQALGTPRLMDQGPYAVAARRYATGVPSKEVTIRVEPPSRD